ncbi:MAG: VOC family protein [Gammaproteobacteria bacterium]|nr:VOC family protein [Gammaproteobacteria bacterium]
MHKSRLGALVVDCQTDDLYREGKFWSKALGSTPEAQDKLISDKYIRLYGQPGEARVILQKVDHPSRVHFDIETDNIDAEVERLESLGATIVERKELWVVMEAPSKQRFCVIGPIRSDFEANANVWK